MTKESGQVGVEKSGQDQRPRHEIGRMIYPHGIAVIGFASEERSDYAADGWVEAERLGSLDEAFPIMQDLLMKGTPVHLGNFGGAPGGNDALFGGTPKKTPHFRIDFLVEADNGLRGAAEIFIHEPLVDAIDFIDDELEDKLGSNRLQLVSTRVVSTQTGKVIYDPNASALAEKKASETPISH